MVTNALIPEERVSSRELKDIKKTLQKMKTGKEKTFEEVFS